MADSIVRRHVLQQSVSSRVRRSPNGWRTVASDSAKPKVSRMRIKRMAMYRAPKRGFLLAALVVLLPALCCRVNVPSGDVVVNHVCCQAEPIQTPVPPDRSEECRCAYSVAMPTDVHLPMNAGCIAPGVLSLPPHPGRLAGSPPVPFHSGPPLHVLQCVWLI